MKRKHWIDTDLDGLAKILQRKGGKHFAIYELIQNCWDQNVNSVSVTIIPIPNRPAAKITVVDDDPCGFSDLTQSFTLFADSPKKNDPTKAGRFNLGEKLVLSLCEEAHIMTTTGSVHFCKNGSRLSSKDKTEKGSIFEGVMKIQRDEMYEAIKSLNNLIPPENVITEVNGNRIPPRFPIRTFTAILPTEAADAEGNLKRTQRKVQVDVIVPRKGETASIYELGIPVVKTNDKYHIDIHQKIPLNMDRDNVPPAFLQTIRTFVLNNTHFLLEVEDATKDWVQKASSDERCSGDAIKKIMSLRFGDKRVSNDLSDPEGTKIAMSEEYTVVFGGALSKGQWDNVRKAKAIKPAGEVTPSPKPYDPEGSKLNEIPESKWTKKMKLLVSFYKGLAPELIQNPILIKIANDHGLQAKATYGSSGILVLNKARLGNLFFEEFPDNMEEACDLLIHELGHEYSLDHLSRKYHRVLTRLGAKLTMAALNSPELFQADLQEVKV